MRKKVTFPDNFFGNVYSLVIVVQYCPRVFVQSSNQIQPVDTSLSLLDFRSLKDNYLLLIVCFGILITVITSLPWHFLSTKSTIHLEQSTET